MSSPATLQTGRHQPAEDRGWRWRECPMMGPVGERWGEEGLQAAGYYDDGLSRAQVSKARRGWDAPTPTWKLRGQRGGIVLLATGAFSPVHRGHVAMLDAAARALEGRGLKISGGYLAPDHDGYVGQKAGGTAALGAPWRIRLAQLATAEHPWLMVDPWLALWTPRDLNYTDAYLRLQGLLDRRGRGEQACLVIGEDNAGFARMLTSSGRAVVIRREGSAGKGETELGRPELRRARRDGRLLMVDAPAEAWGASSTQARREGLHLDPAVTEQLRAWGIELSRLAEQTPTQAGPAGWYALRGDLGWATRQWDIPGKDARLARFQQGLSAAIEEAFSGAEAPDHPRRVQTRILPLAPQVAAARRVQGQGPSINLDLISADQIGGERLDLSREFELSGPQLHGLHLVERPGAPSLEAQLQRLEPGPRVVTLIDDDVASGQTMALTRALLMQRRIEVGQAASLLDASFQGEGPIDVCDARDFLLGTREGGLTTRLEDGRACRAPYLAPWVDLHSRARVPLGRAQAFSRQLWSLNLAFFEGSGLLVRDAWPATRTLLEEQWDTRTPLEQVCREVLARHRDATDA